MKHAKGMLIYETISWLCTLAPPHPPPSRYPTAACLPARQVVPAEWLHLLERRLTRTADKHHFRYTSNFRYTFIEASCARQAATLVQADWLCRLMEVQALHTAACKLHLKHPCICAAGGDAGAGRLAVPADGCAGAVHLQPQHRPLCAPHPRGPRHGRPGRALFLLRLTPICEPLGN